MVGSSSVSVGNRIRTDYLSFLKKNFIHSIISILCMIFVFNVPIYKWKKNKNKLILCSIILLLTLNYFGISNHGAKRWINIKIAFIQPSELVKISFSCYLSSYLSEKNKKTSTIQLISIILIVSKLLLSQPDFGTLVILYSSLLFMLFLIGKNFLFLSASSAIFTTIVLSLIYFRSYRAKRLISFLNPWSNYLGDGYQLVHSMLSFGRGKMFGQGIGNSIQKINFLPEPHTDFIISIIGEELGYLGIAMIVISLFFIFFQGMNIGRNALKDFQYFSGFLAYSISLLIIIQSIINIGSSIGILPIKGTTLPIISYGGSSKLITCIKIAILLRIDFETKMNKIQAFRR